MAVLFAVLSYLIYIAALMCSHLYWNAAAIAEDYDQATMENVIELFVTENLSEAE